MALELNDLLFQGPALTEPFVKFELERELTRLRLLPRATGEEGRELKDAWDAYRRKLRALAASGGSLRVFHHVIEPLMPLMGYSRSEESGKVTTREDQEDGGRLLISTDEQFRLRVWTTGFDEDLQAPAKRGRAYRFSHQRIAQRVLLATGERLGLLTNGVQLLLLISDPARPDSTVTVPLDAGWKTIRDLPDSLRFVLALACPRGVQALPELVDKARLQQARVTKELRKQARHAVERFLQAIIDHPNNREWFASQTDRDALAKTLWREGLITVYRLLFILKLESSDDSARSFSFASTSLWRNTFSPSTALSRYAQDALHGGAETGSLLESGLRALYRLFEHGLECTELVVKPLGGALFGPTATPVLSSLTWGERAVAHLLDQLLWTTPARRGGNVTRERVHYGPLDVEDLGRVYEALLELEPGITTEPMCRLRRQKLEVVVPLAQGEQYRPAVPAIADDTDAAEDAEDAAELDDESEEAPTRARATRVVWIEEISPQRFYLRVGLGRKASGSYYTPHSFVRFLVQETLGPQVAERSPAENPQPMEILKLKVLDPAMGSGHFLIEACRFLGEKLYEACRLCDERALAALRKAENAKIAEDKEAAEAEAREWSQRIIDLPDPDDELLKYLPSRSPEGSESGLSQSRAIALCRRLVTTHCLYGVDKNPLAVELAKLALWLESHAEGMPLTFLDHRFVLGDSLTGSFWDKLMFRPSKPTEPIENLFSDGLSLKFRNALTDAIRYVRDLEASVGATVAEVQRKERTKRELDRALLPFRIAAAAWSGGVMLGPEQCDDVAYAELLKSIADTGELPSHIESPRLCKMVARGLGVEECPADSDAIYSLVNSGTCDVALSYDLTFPEVFYPTGVPYGRQGFNCVLGNPPWEGLDTSNKEFFAGFDIGILETTTEQEQSAILDRLLAQPQIKHARDQYDASVEAYKTISANFFSYVNQSADGSSAATPDMYQCFSERSAQLTTNAGYIGIVLPSSFHANDGATGIRRLYMQRNALRSCYSFENRRKLFEIDSRFKFATVVVQASQQTTSFSCAFYLHDDEWLFASDKGERLLNYSLDFIQATTGDSLNFLELRSTGSVPIAQSMYRTKECLFGRLREDWGIFPTEELHTSKQRHRTQPISVLYPTSINDSRSPDTLTPLLALGILPVCKGEHFHQYDAMWGTSPEAATTVAAMRGKEARLVAATNFRFVIRQQASSTNERTVITFMSPPGLLYFHSALPERDSLQRPNSRALALVALSNSYSFDWLVRLVVAANVTFNFLDSVPVPRLSDILLLLVHSALRLTCNHAGYAALWHEQLGDTWREPEGHPQTWPVIPDNDSRWRIRAVVDAVVSDAYGLSRDQYEQILSAFSHSSYPQAPEVCLATFDELKQLGLDAFTKKHDPYWDIPLTESLPQPVIELPALPSASNPSAGENMLFDAGPARPPRRRGRR